MLILLSPAKTLDFDSARQTEQASQPELLAQATELMAFCRQLSTSDIQQLMQISPALATLNYHRFQQWQPPFTLNNARQAILAFNGDVYEGLDVKHFSESDLNYAQQHLVILSGLYGLLRPLDLIQAYRLEMGIRLATPAGNTLYQFWGDQLSDRLHQRLSQQTSPFLINLASDEYFKVIKSKKLINSTIKPVFLDKKGAEYKVISFYAKKARGMMARFIVTQQIDKPEGIKDFSDAGYHFDNLLSTQHEYYFKRDH